MIPAAIAAGLGQAIAAPDTGSATSGSGATLGGNISFGGPGLPQWVAPAALALGVLLLVMMTKGGRR